MKYVKVSDELHHRLRVMAALSSQTMLELLDELLQKPTDPFKNVKWPARQTKKRHEKKPKT